MGFNSAFNGLKLLKNPGNGRLNILNDPVLNVLKCMEFLWEAERLGFLRRRQQDKGQNLSLYSYFCKLLLGCTGRVLQYKPVAASRK
jgi:hypothetical protein